MVKILTESDFVKLSPHTSVEQLSLLSEDGTTLAWTLKGHDDRSKSSVSAIEAIGAAGADSGTGGVGVPTKLLAKLSPQLSRCSEAVGVAADLTKLSLKGLGVPRSLVEAVDDIELRLTLVTESRPVPITVPVPETERLSLLCLRPPCPMVEYPFILKLWARSELM